MPLNWNQARAGLDPRKFTIRTAAGLLERSGVWEDYARSPRPLVPAIERLAAGVRPRGQAQNRKSAASRQTVTEKRME
jgi:bifunctional non-homologous end joining protein LigD